MTPQASRARLQQRIAQIEPAILAEASRWGDSKTATPLDKDTWWAEVNWLLSQYFTNRTNTVRGQLRAEVVPPIRSEPAGPVAAGATLQMTAAGAGVGATYYTTDGVTDPRLIGGAINLSPEVIVYADPLQLTESIIVRARFRSSAGHWSHLVEATYLVTSRSDDFNGDGVVSGHDLLVWQQQWGSVVYPNGSGADGNGDGRVGRADLALWESTFSSQSSARVEQLVGAKAEVAGADRLVPMDQCEAAKWMRCEGITNDPFDRLTSSWHEIDQYYDELASATINHALNRKLPLPTFGVAR